MSPAPHRYFEDFGVGDVIELGGFPPLSEEDIVAFARQWDPQPFHVDRERAKESIFGGLIASGWHTGAIAMRLLVDGLLNRSAAQGSPGANGIRFLRPVRPGDSLSARYTVLEVARSASRPALGKVRALTELVNQHGEVVLTMDATGFFDRRDGAADGPAGIHQENDAAG
jgi:acyl dehydratase